MMIVNKNSNFEIVNFQITILSISMLMKIATKKMRHASSTVSMTILCVPRDLMCA